MATYLDLVIVPVRFYGYDTIIYLLSAVIGLMIAHSAYKIYKLSEKKQHFYLSAAFTILGICFLTISLTSAYTYYRYFVVGDVYPFDPLFGLEDLGYWLYYIGSLVAYGLLALMYIPEDIRKKFLPAVFFTPTYFTYLNVVAFFVLAFTAFRSVSYYLHEKKRSAGLVALSFVLLTAYHALLPFAVFSKLLYVVAHVSLILSFLSLLVMLNLPERKR